MIGALLVALLALRGTETKRASINSASRLARIIPVETPPGVVRYAAVGDSYTIGQGATADQCWPEVVAAHLTQSGVPTRVVANAALTGWTTQDVLDQGLPFYEAARPTFATLQIGVNDWIGGATPAQFHTNLTRVLNRMLKVLPNPQHLLLVTIPDFSVTPQGARYNRRGGASGGISAFNAIIIAEAQRRHLPVVDIFGISQKMGSDITLVADDELHPSALEYEHWGEQIYPVALHLLQTTTPASAK